MEWGGFFTREEIEQILYANGYHICKVVAWYDSTLHSTMDEWRKIEILIAVKDGEEIEELKKEMPLLCELTPHKVDNVLTDLIKSLLLSNLIKK